MVVSSFHRSLPWLSAPCPPPFLRVSLRLVSCLLRFHSTRSARPVGEEDVRRTTRRKSGEYRSGTGEIKCQEADHLGSRPSVTHGPRSVRSVPLVPHFLHSSSVPLPRSLPPSPSPPGGRRPGDGCRHHDQSTSLLCRYRSSLVATRCMVMRDEEIRPAVTA